ncbi:MAG: hypothetical protein ACSHX0_02185 [Akkermansiaceae bacterium]
MKPYRKIIVPLGLIGNDEGAISWASKVYDLAESAEVVFFHAYKVPEMPSAATEKHPWLLDPIDSQLVDEMKKLVQKHWGDDDTVAIRYKAVEDKSPLFALLREIRDFNAYLVVIGKKAFKSDIAVHLALKVPCSIISVPKMSKAKLDKIMLKTSFSDHSQEALDIGIAFAEAADMKAIDSLNVFSLGTMSHRVTSPDSIPLENAVKRRGIRNESVSSGIITQSETTPVITTKIRVADQNFLSDLIGA